RHNCLGAFHRGAGAAVSRCNEKGHASRYRARLGKYVRRRGSFATPVKGKRRLRRGRCRVLPEAQGRVQGPLAGLFMNPLAPLLDPCPHKKLSSLGNTHWYSARSENSSLEQVADKSLRKSRRFMNSPG